MPNLSWLLLLALPACLPPGTAADPTVHPRSPSAGCNGGAVIVNATSSARMASSIMSRGQGIMTGLGGSSELLQAGVVQRALTALAAQYPGTDVASAAAAYAQRSVLSVANFTANATRDALSYPMDRLSSGHALLDLARADPSVLRLDAAEADAVNASLSALRESIDLNRRNQFGGMWYYVYPQWSYLDGMFSLGPFYTEYSLRTPPSNDTSSAAAANASLADVQLQFDLLWTRTRNATSGLLAHGYDASGTAVWADAATGASPHVWGRSLGWYSLALVETLEILLSLQNSNNNSSQSASLALADFLRTKWQALAPALLAAADNRTGAWWQVMDAPGRAGNYIESSAGAMFAYALLKSARLGFLPAAPAAGEEKDGDLAARAVGAGLGALDYLTRTFVVDNGNGTVGWNGTVAVCSLNSTANYTYYVSQPILYNSVLGSGPYILASLEAERLRS